MKIRRTDDWEYQLGAVFERSRRLKFVWGSFDCALFAADCIHAMTGVDPGKQFRGAYTSRNQADLLFQQYGGSLQDLAAKVMLDIDFPEITPPTFARRGDLLLVENPLGSALGIVGLRGHSALCASEDGLTEVPMKRWLRAWRVG